MPDIIIIDHVIISKLQLKIFSILMVIRKIQKKYELQETIQDMVPIYSKHIHKISIESLVLIH
jgi:hypothetical protein